MFVDAKKLFEFNQIRHIQKNNQSASASLFYVILRLHIHLNPEVRGQKPDGIRLGYCFLISCPCQLTSGDVPPCLT